MVAVYPSLIGYEREPKKIIDLVFSSYLLSDGSQSNEFKDNVISLPKRIQTFTDNEYELAEAIELDLTSCFKGYFDTVNIDVTFLTIDETEDNTIHFIVKGTVFRNGVSYDLGRTLAVSDTKTVSVINVLSN